MANIIYFLAIVAIFALPLVLVAALVKPAPFTRFFRGKGTRGSLALRITALLLVGIIAVAVFEPASVKQAGIERRKQAALISHQKLDAEAKAKAAALASADSEHQAAQLKDEQLKLAATKKAAEPVEVVSVTDGDTIKVRIDGKIDIVRLVGTNAPEASECFGPEATQAMIALVSGKHVRLERDAQQGDRDKYNRLLRFVFLEDGTNTGTRMLADGDAYEALYSKQPHIYRTDYVQAQADARSAQKGLWATQTCNGKRAKPAVQSPAPAATPAPTPAAAAPRSTAQVAAPVAVPAPAPSSVYYANCTAVKAAGAAPIYPGQPGFRAAFDRDNDGVGCEN